MMAAVRAGLQNAYLESLEFMRGKILDTENDLRALKRSFYHCEENDDSEYIDYLQDWDNKLLYANNELRKSGTPLEIIDGELRLVSLLNSLREVDGDAECISDATEFWEEIKTVTEGLDTMVNQFQTNVLNKLKKNCISYNNAEIHLVVANRYTEEISAYLNEMEQTLTSTQLLLKSFNSGVHQELFTKDEFSERLLVMCDLKAFPILRFVPDVTAKIQTMCTIARQWLDRDEKYMYEINSFIRETRNITKRREEDLRTQKGKQKKVEKAVKSAHILLNNNREKLQNIESELFVLEDQVTDFRNEKKCKNEEKQQKESMADFLKLTLAQTKRNYSLQTKRSKLVKQVHELDTFLREIEKDLHDIQNQVEHKSKERVRIAEKVENTEKSYDALKTDLDKFSGNMENLEYEVTELSSQLLQLELIQTYKTCPEKIEEIYDRPSTVKLAPSLKEKIKRKRRTLAAS